MKTRARTTWAWLLVAALASSCGGGSSPPAPTTVTLDVTGWFAPGTLVHDAYSGSSATVAADGKLTVQPDPEGVVLLEPDGATASPFDWKNAVVYFAMTDRFYDGDPSNDASYGRKRDGAQDIGTWHGGDWKGIAAKLDHLQALGATALWISPIVEQVHGWVGGGSAGDFRHYGYHGYWALDFTRLDASFGTGGDLQALIDAAHARGIRVLVDVVMNHPGYATGQDLVSYLPAVFKDGTGAAFTAWDTTATGNFFGWNDYVDYASAAWSGWWSGSWVRAGLGPPGTYPQPNPSDPLTMSLGSLPDFITESTAVAGVPPLFTAGHKTDTGVVDLPNGTVRDYLVKWHTDWVRQYGIDGFRCDTAKHVELASWKALKDAALTALADWKAANPGKKLDDAPFWMTGEVFPHGVVKDTYYTDGGFDSLINTTFQSALQTAIVNGTTLVGAAGNLDAIYGAYASQLASDPSFDALSYVSSHDTALFFETMGRSPERQRMAGTALLLTPGGVQVFYGDETGRRNGPGGSDPTQPTRSDMNWDSEDATILGHWSKVAAFRKRHAAIGAGTHVKLASPSGTYAFGRRLPAGGDPVVVLFTK